MLAVSEVSIVAAVQTLQEGGVVLLPTDTVYGLAVHPEFATGIDRLYEMKQRPRNLPLPVMVAKVEDIEQLGGVLNARSRSLLASEYVPGALTIVVGLDHKERVPSWLAEREEVAIRIPDDEHLLAILRRCGPLFVTSANASGEDTPMEVAEILEQLHQPPALAIDGGSVPTIPSTLVNCRLDPPVVEREGVIPTTELASYLS